MNYRIFVVCIAFATLVASCENVGKSTKKEEEPKQEESAPQIGSEPVENLKIFGQFVCSEPINMYWGARTSDPLMDSIGGRTLVLEPMTAFKIDGMYRNQGLDYYTAIFPVCKTNCETDSLRNGWVMRGVRKLELKPGTVAKASMSQISRDLEGTGECQ